MSHYSYRQKQMLVIARTDYLNYKERKKWQGKESHSQYDFPLTSVKILKSDYWG